MSKDDDLVFNPSERVVPHSMETIRPRGTQAATPVAPALVTPISPQSQSTAATPPAIQARPVPPRQKNPQQQAAQHVGRQIKQAVPQVANPAVGRTAAPEARLEDVVVHQYEPEFGTPAVDTRPQKVVTTQFEDIGLPSGFAPYDWKDIQIRRFNIEELRAVVRARVSGNLRYLVRAMDATISRYAEDLTVGDFWYMMYWHRLNSYKKSPFIIQWTCDNQEHIHNVAKGKQVQVEKEEYDELPEAERLLYEWDEPVGEPPVEHHFIEYFKIVKTPAETLKNLLQVTGSNLTTQDMATAEFEKQRQAILDTYDVDVMPHMLMDLIEALESNEDNQIERQKRKAAQEKSLEDGDVTSFIEAAEAEEMVEDEEKAFMYRYAAVLARSHGRTLEDRATYLNAQDPDLLVDLEDFLIAAEHGVTESWLVKCKECGAPKTVNQSLDALTFLPSLQRGGLA